jgi:hypothetical protein
VSRLGRNVQDALLLLACWRRFRAGRAIAEPALVIPWAWLCSFLPVRKSPAGRARFPQLLDGGWLISTLTRWSCSTRLLRFSSGAWVSADLRRGALDGLL